MIDISDPLAIIYQLPILNTARFSAVDPGELTLDMGAFVVTVPEGGYAADAPGKQGFFGIAGLMMIVEYSLNAVLDKHCVLLPWIDECRGL